jgi:hypothetical protein
VQKNRVRRPETRINTESASANCGTWVTLAEPWLSQFANKQITEQQLSQAARQFNNVIKQIDITWRVIKLGLPA